VVRDSSVNDAWNHGGGGNAYVGWDYSWDNLMERVTTTNQRHAPNFQLGASGNVVRDSVFHDSDAQWHAGWVHENLIENCVIGPPTVPQSYGYGQGVFGTNPSDALHGPVGPRNVVFGSDITSSKDGIRLGGYNEAYLILYNRFVVTGSAPGFRQRITGFDHLIRGNAYNLASASSPLLYLPSPDSVGVSLLDNQLYGGSGFYSGLPPIDESGNRVVTVPPPRPTPPVPSIYQWELDHAR
jgi:hypothetical protein